MLRPLCLSFCPFACLLVIASAGCAPKPNLITLDVLFIGGLVYDGTGAKAGHQLMLNGYK